MTEEASFQIREQDVVLFVVSVDANATGLLLQAHCTIDVHADACIYETEWPHTLSLTDGVGCTPDCVCVPGCHCLHMKMLSC